MPFSPTDVRSTTFPAAFVKAYGPLVAFYVGCRAGSEAERDERFRHAITRLLGEGWLRRYDGAVSFERFLYVCLRFAMADYARRVKGISPSGTRHMEGWALPAASAPVITEAEEAFLMDWVAGLDVKDRLVLKLTYWDLFGGLTAEEERYLSVQSGWQPEVWERARAGFEADVRVHELIAAYCSGPGNAQPAPTAGAGWGGTELSAGSAAVAELPVTTQAVAFKGHNLEQVGRVLGFPGTAVEQRLYRLRRKLADKGDADLLDRWVAKQLKRRAERAELSDALIARYVRGELADAEWAALEACLSATPVWQERVEAWKRAHIPPLPDRLAAWVGDYVQKVTECSDDLPRVGVARKGEAVEVTVSGAPLIAEEAVSTPARRADRYAQAMRVHVGIIPLRAELSLTATVNRFGQWRVELGWVGEHGPLVSVPVVWRSASGEEKRWKTNLRGRCEGWLSPGTYALALQQDPVVEVVFTS